jgi:hypothetical protein
MDYQVPPPETVQELARLVRCTFSLETRDNGTEYWTHNRCAPDWINELCHTAHGDMLPDDYRYAFIVEALNALEEVEDPDEARDGYELEPYFGRLVDWLGSYAGHRFEYCDEWAEESAREFEAEPVLRPDMGQPKDTYHRLAGGHLAERWEVLDLVRGSLEEQLQAMAAA